MAEDFGEKLKQILSDPEAMSTVSALLGEKLPDENVAGKSSDTSFEDTIKNALSSFGGASDRRINLLYALKPYMRQSRADNIDRAIKMLKLTKLSSVFKNL